MLVLSRKNLESVVIGEGSSASPVLTVTVLEIRGGRVKLGFACAPAVRVQRSEVWNRIHTGDEAAGQTEEFNVSIVH